MGTKLVILDLDGLLVDTETLFFKAFKKISKKYGQKPSFLEYTREVISLGRDFVSLVNLRDDQKEKFKASVYAEYKNLLERELSLREGAIECLKKLQDFQCALVTASKREYSELILRQLDIKKYFIDIITRDDDFPLKPNPAVFESLLKKYSSKPWECCVIEDSIRGIMAAQALRIPCILIPNEYTRHDEFGEDVLRLKSLKEIDCRIVLQLMKDAEPHDIGHTLENVYRDSMTRLRSLIDSYKLIYELPEYIHKDVNIIPEAFEYAKKRLYFVILVLHTKDGRVFFQRSFDSGHLSMNLPGGSIRLNEEDTIVTAIERIAKQSIEKAKLADIAPIMFLTNKFCCKDGNTTNHYGFGIRGLLLNEDEMPSADDYLFKGSFLKNFPPDEIPHAPSRETYKKFLQWFNTRRYATYKNEIDTQRAVLGRYQIHQSFVNPIFKKLSYILGKFSISQVKKELVDTAGQTSFCIDVACGDDYGVFDLLRNVRLVIANDISTDQINHMEKKYRKNLSRFPKSNSLLFTNHDCLDLPFKDKAFDVAICRNLLHHMISGEHLEMLLNNLARVAQRIVFQEIQDPERENIWGRLRHQYYKRFLKDEGKHFYDKEAFRDVLITRFGQENVKFKYFPTIRGIYMMAEIFRPSIK